MPTDSEWETIGNKNLALELDPAEIYMIQMSAMRVSAMHAYHECDMEHTADGLLEKINDAIDEQIEGR